MKIMSIISTFALVATISTASFVPVASAVGGMSTGGGELIKDSANPWFIQNTGEVTYCIEMDSNNFHQDLEVVRKMIDKAFAYWRTELQSGYVAAGESVGIWIGGQKFTEGACDHAEVHFQLGRLTDRQKTELGDPRDFIATTIRESYDAVRMKGRGFIYISPDTGPLAPLASNLLPDRWRVDGGIRLYGVLIHELGHMFGVPHSGSPFSIMGAGYPEKMVTSGADQHMGRTRRLEIPNFFRYDRSSREGGAYCAHPGPSYIDFFGIPPGNWSTLYTRMHDDILEISVGTKCDDTAPRVVVGEAILGRHFNWTPDYSVAVNVFLPPEQRVYPNIPQWVGKNVPAVARLIEARVGTYRPLNGGPERQISITHDPALEVFMLGGIYDGRLVPDILMELGASIADR